MDTNPTVTNMFRRWSALLDRNQFPLLGSGGDWTEDDPDEEISRLRAALSGLAQGNPSVVRYLREEHGIELDDD
jgi:hypothetical protein